MAPGTGAGGGGELFHYVSAKAACGVRVDAEVWAGILTTVFLQGSRCSVIPFADGYIGCLSFC